jgi:thiol-disulfide isomerase/thioredoxin
LNSAEGKTATLQKTGDFSMLSRRSVLFGTLIATAAAGTPAFAAETRTYDPASFAAAEKAGKPILIAVHASWCPTCKAQKPILSELTADPKFNNLVYFVVDFDSQKDAVKFFGAREQWLCSKATRKPAARSATPTAPRSPRF